VRKGLSPLVPLFGLPDNAYILGAVLLVKQQRDALGLGGVLSEAQKTAPPKARERLAFILQ
jgi:hypothetical protein